MMKKEFAKKRRIVITAGATREYIDPVRFITNGSTGLMGLELAECAAEKGYEVTLVKTLSVKGPDNPDIVVRKVITSEDMARAVLELEREADCLIMAAAVTDLRPIKSEREKIRKKDSISLSLERTTDILASSGKTTDLIKIGFALETHDLEKKAAEKLESKDLDLIVANIYSEENDPFGEGSKDFLIIDKEGRKAKYEKVSKTFLAEKIILEVEKLMERINETV